MEYKNYASIYDSIAIANMEKCIQSAIEYKFPMVSDVDVEIIGGYGASEVHIGFVGDAGLLLTIKQFVSEFINNTNNEH